MLTTWRDLQMRSTATLKNRQQSARYAGPSGSFEGLTLSESTGSPDVGPALNCGTPCRACEARAVHGVPGW